MLKRVGAFFLIKEAELPQVGYFLLFFFLIGAGLALGRGTSDALFFKRYGFQYLPVLYVILAVLMMVVTMAYAAFADRLPAERLFKVFFTTIFCLLIGNWALIEFSVTEAAYPVYFLLYELASDLLILHFSLYVNQNFETLQAKRLLPLVFAGAQLGTIVGGVFLAVAAPYTGVPNILLIWCGLIVAAMSLMLVHHRRHGASPHFRPSRKSCGMFNQCVTQIGQGFKFAKTSDLVRYSSLALFFAAIMFYILSYSVNRVYAETFTTEESLTAFFGVLTAVTSTLALLIQLFLTNKLLHRFGVRTVNLIFPITSVISYGLLILSFSLPAAIFASINKDSFMKAFRNPVRNLLFNALPNYMQGRARAMAAGLVLPLALALAGGVLVLAQIYQVPIYFLIVGLTASAVYLYFNTKTNRAYVVSMISALREKLFLSEQPLDMALKSAGEDLIKELRRGIHEGEDEVSIAYAKKLASLFPKEAAESILTRLSRSSPGTRDQLVKLLPSLNPPRLHEHLLRELDSADDHLKATILDWLFELGDERARDMVEAALVSGNPRLAAVGILGVYRYSLNSLKARAEHTLTGMLASDDPATIAAGLELLRKRPDPRHRATLLKLLLHPTARLRRLALEALANWPESLPDSAPMLLDLTHDPDADIRMACVRCSRSLPADERSRLLLVAVEDVHADVRRAAVYEISHDSGQADVYLADWIVRNHGSVRTQETVLRALLAHRPAKKILEHIALCKANDAQVLAHARTVLRRSALGTTLDPELELMAYVLDERLHQTIDLSLLAIEHVENPADITVIRAGLRSGDRRYTANAIEAVRHIHNRSLAAMLTNVLDSVSPSGTIVASKGRVFENVKDMLTWYRDSKDPWLRTCAERALNADVTVS